MSEVIYMKYNIFSIIYNVVLNKIQFSTSLKFFLSYWDLCMLWRTFSKILFISVIALWGSPRCGYWSCLVSTLNTTRTLRFIFGSTFLLTGNFFVHSLSLHPLLPCPKLTASNLLCSEYTVDKLSSWKSRHWGRRWKRFDGKSWAFLLHGLCKFGWFLRGLLLFFFFLYSRLLRLFSDWKPG